MLIHLDFGDNVFAQILSSFAVPRTQDAGAGAARHQRHGQLVATQEWYNAKGPVDIFLRDESPLGIEDWADRQPPVAEPARRT